RERQLKTAGRLRLDSSKAGSRTVAQGRLRARDNSTGYRLNCTRRRLTLSWPLLVSISSDVDTQAGFPAIVELRSDLTGTPRARAACNAVLGIRRDPQSRTRSHHL